METPRRATRTPFPSGRILEAQRNFQSVVKQELQLLLTRGTKREVAVKLLLKRIVQSTEPPEPAAVRGVMRQFQMNYDDAVRALIVKQELGRLKRQGLDSFAAIEELTRKMKSQEEETVQDEKQTVEDEKQQEESNGKEEEETQDTRDDIQEKTLLEVTSPTAETDKDAQESSLSLIQRIGQVSISSGNTPEKITGEDVQKSQQDTDSEVADEGKEDKTEEFSTPARIRSPTGGDVADLTPQTRKRRAAFDIQIETSSSRSGGRSVQPLFPSLKKQKRCAEMGDGFLQVVTRKSKPTSSALSKNASPTGTASASHNGNGGGSSTRGDLTTKNLHKRQRASPTGMQDDDESPVAEDLRVSHVHHRHHHGHHHSKRHKSSSTH